jgi:hypothetical protein
MRCQTVAAAAGGTAATGGISACQAARAALNLA